MNRFFRVVNEIANCYWLYRCLFIIDLPSMIGVPIEVLMREHVSDARFLNSFLCWCFTVLCWKNMRWDLLFTSSKKGSKQNE